MIPPGLIPSLAGAANAEIDRAMASPNPIWIGKYPNDEVSFVAAFVLFGVAGVAGSWNKILNPLGLQVVSSGVVCHGRYTEAVFTDALGRKMRCELADLLVVIDDNASTPNKRMAVLVQAKMADSGGGKHIKDVGDLKQHELLSKWPPFTLPKKNFDSRTRDFCTCAFPGKPLDCGWYGLIKDQPSPEWHQQAPAISMPAGGDKLGTFLANMAASQPDYGREAAVSGRGDDWSFTVDELLRVTGSKGILFSHKPGLVGRHPRYISAFGVHGRSIAMIWSDHAILVPHHFYGMPPFGGAPDDSDGEPPEGGMSIAYFSISRKDDRD
ncbi:MAG: hypothetical protein WCF85_09920 [Rhodospirillaceae bacterium]